MEELAESIRIEVRTRTRVEVLELTAKELGGLEVVVDVEREPEEVDPLLHRRPYRVLLPGPVVQIAIEAKSRGGLEMAVRSVDRPVRAQIIDVPLPSTQETT